MGYPITTSLAPIAAVANGIGLSQSVSGASPLILLNGSLVNAAGVAVLDIPRRIAITSVGNDSGINWTVTGISRSQLGSIAFSETFAGANAGAAFSTQDFAQVTSITSSGATASTVTAGTNGVASGPWVPWSDLVQGGAFNVSCNGIVISGTPTWQVEMTFDDVFGNFLPAGVPFPRPTLHPTLVNMTQNGYGTITQPCRASRLTLTAIGSVQLVQQQAGF